MSFEAKRCGVQFNPPSIILIYEHKDTKRVRKRVMPVRSFSKYSGMERDIELFNVIYNIIKVAIQLGAHTQTLFFLLLNHRSPGPSLHKIRITVNNIR